MENALSFGFIQPISCNNSYNAETKIIAVGSANLRKLTFCYDFYYCIFILQSAYIFIYILNTIIIIQNINFFQHLVQNRVKKGLIGQFEPLIQATLHYFQTVFAETMYG